MFSNSFFSSLVGGLCLLLGLSVCWLGGYVCYWVCLFFGWWLCDNIISFNSRDGVSVVLFITDLNQSHGF